MFAVVWLRGQMDPVAVLRALEALGYSSDALEAVGQRIISEEVVGVDELAAAGLCGSDIVAVRRALDPLVRACSTLCAAADRLWELCG